MKTNSSQIQTYERPSLTAKEVSLSLKECDYVALWQHNALMLLVVFPLIHPNKYLNGQKKPKNA